MTEDPAEIHNLANVQPDIVRKFDRQPREVAPGLGVEYEGDHG